MRSRSECRATLVLGVLAAAGVLVAHGLAYVIAVPDPHARARLLESTGHGHKLIVAVALGVLVAGVARLSLPRVCNSNPRRGRALFTFAVPRLIGLQVLGFGVLEAVERWWAGAAVADMVAEPAVLLGMALQIFAAIVGAALLALVATAIERLVRGWARVTRYATALSLKPSCRLWVPALHVASGGATLRGPPLAG